MICFYRSVVIASVMLALGMGTGAESATVDLSCTPGEGPVVATSFVLLQKSPGQTQYIAVLENPTCDFPATSIPDTGYTCFRFGAKNDRGTTVRNWTDVCVNPSVMPAPVPPAPSSAKIK